MEEGSKTLRRKYGGKIFKAIRQQNCTRQNITSEEYFIPSYLIYDMIATIINEDIISYVPFKPILNSCPINRAAILNTFRKK